MKLQHIQSFDDFINEAVRRTADQVNKDAEFALKGQIDRYSELMKTKPEKANFYKAMLDLAHAKMTVLSLKRKVDALRESTEFDSSDVVNESVYPDKNGQLSSYDKKTFTEVGRHTITIGKDLAAIILFGYSKMDWKGKEEWTTYVTCTSYDTTVRNYGNSNGSMIYSETWDSEDSAKNYASQLLKSFKVK
jgi:hypothetical protein